MTLARVSVLRGQGEQTGVPFVDDHIDTHDTIADYLTEFSGILRVFYSALLQHALTERQLATWMQIHHLIRLYR